MIRSKFKSEVHSQETQQQTNFEEMSRSVHLDQAVGELLEQFVLYGRDSDTNDSQKQRLSAFKSKAREEYLGNSSGFSSFHDFLINRIISSIENEDIRGRVSTIMTSLKEKSASISDILALAQCQIDLAASTKRFDLQLLSHQNKLIQKLLTYRPDSRLTGLKQAKVYLERKVRRMEGAYPKWFCDELASSLERVYKALDESGQQVHKHRNSTISGQGSLQPDGAEVLAVLKVTYEGWLDQAQKNSDSLIQTLKTRSEGYEKKLEELNSKLMAESVLSETRRCRIAELETSLKQNPERSNLRESNFAKLTADQEIIIVEMRRERDEAMSAKDKAQEDLDKAAADARQALQERDRALHDERMSQATLKDKEIELQGIKNELDAKTEEISLCQSALKTSVETIGNLKRELAESNRHRTNAQVQLEDLEGQKSNIEGRLSAVELELDESRIAVACLEEEISLSKEMEGDLRSVTKELRKYVSLEENMAFEPAVKATDRSPEPPLTEPLIAKGNPTDETLTETFSDQAPPDAFNMMLAPPAREVAPANIFAPQTSNLRGSNNSPISEGMTVAGPSKPRASDEGALTTATSSPTAAKASIASSMAATHAPKYLPEFSIEAYQQETGLVGYCHKCGHDYEHRGYEEFKQGHESKCKGATKKKVQDCKYCSQPQFINRYFFNVHVPHCKYMKHGRLCGLCGFWIKKDGFFDEHLPACKNKQRAGTGTKGARPKFQSTEDKSDPGSKALFTQLSAAAPTFEPFFPGPSSPNLMAHLPSTDSTFDFNSTEKTQAEQLKVSPFGPFDRSAPQVSVQSAPQTPHLPVSPKPSPSNDGGDDTSRISEHQDTTGKKPGLGKSRWALEEGGASMSIKAPQPEAPPVIANPASIFDQAEKISTSPFIFKTTEEKPLTWSSNSSLYDDLDEEEPFQPSLPEATSSQERLGKDTTASTSGAHGGLLGHSQWADRGESWQSDQNGHPSGLARRYQTRGKSIHFGGSNKKSFKNSRNQRANKQASDLKAEAHADNPRGSDTTN